MKIDTELRHAITAAARANSRRTDNSHENEQNAVDAFLSTKKGSALKNRIMAIQQQIDRLDDQRSTLRKKIYAITGPLGLDLNERTNRVTKKKEHFLKLGYGDEEKIAFVKAGGVLPAPERRNWTADELLRLLAAAKDQKAFDAILKEYGINWS